MSEASGFDELFDAAHRTVLGVLALLLAAVGGGIAVTPTLGLAANVVGAVLAVAAGLLVVGLVVDGVRAGRTAA